MDTAYSPRLHEEEPSATDNEIQDLLLVAERKSERADTAYSPRFREEEPSATDNEIQDLLLAAERRSERGDSAYSPRAPRGGAFGRRLAAD